MWTRLALGLAASLILILHGGAPARASEQDHERSRSAGPITVAIDHPGPAASTAPHNPLPSPQPVPPSSAPMPHDEAPLGGGSRRSATHEDPRVPCGEGSRIRRPGFDLAKSVAVPSERSILAHATGPSCRTGTTSTAVDRDARRRSTSSTRTDRVLGPVEGPGVVISATGGPRRMALQGAPERSDRVLGQAARSLVTILLISSIVVIFTLFQDRIDRNDPRLAVAPVEAELVLFE
jgi:hypothetical protein